MKTQSNFVENKTDAIDARVNERLLELETEKEEDAAVIIERALDAIYSKFSTSQQFTIELLKFWQDSKRGINSSTEGLVSLLNDAVIDAVIKETKESYY